MEPVVPPTQKALLEALDLSEKILKNIELNELPLANIALKTLRLARLLNDFEMMKIMQYEVGGYPIKKGGLSHEAWALAAKANRMYIHRPSSDDPKEYVFTVSISELEEEIRIAEKALTAARDPNVSVSSSNPNQIVRAPLGNKGERRDIQDKIATSTKRLASRCALIYHYALQKNQELKFSGLADDIFGRIRSRVDTMIGQTVPDAVMRLTAVYENLQSNNPEDWSNAVHSCRRILKDFIMYPENWTVE